MDLVGGIERAGKTLNRLCAAVLGMLAGGIAIAVAVAGYDGYRRGDVTLVLGTGVVSACCAVVGLYMLAVAFGVVENRPVCYFD